MQEKPVKRYLKAIAAWREAGYPERSDEEVRRIYEDYCRLCDQFSEEQQACEVCGCYVRGDEEGLIGLLKWVHGRAIANKIRMATEHCPPPEEKW